MKRMLALVLGLSVAALVGCKTHQDQFVGPFAEEQVNTPLPDGEFGLFKLDPKDYPDMRQAFMDRAGLLEALDKSIQYMKSPSSKRFFPSPNRGDTITHQQVLASLVDFRAMVANPRMTPDQCQQAVMTRYEVWASKGWNWNTRPSNEPGKVWYTGYFTPIYRGSRTRTAEFQYPIYSRPDDLISDPITGDVAGQRQPDGSVKPYPTRRELMTTHKNLITGKELLWFKDPMEPYIIQVQGSAKVILTDGSEILVGYAGKNGREYRGLGSQLLKAGKLDAKHLSLPAVLDYYKAHPGEREEAILNNDSFAFLKIYDAKEWPSGSLGVRVTPMRSLATDKKIFPRAAITFVTVDMATADGGSLPMRRFLCDQDTGGAIRAAGRADIYVGIGDQAGKLAGNQYAEGRLFYLVLRPEIAGNAAFPDLAPVKPKTPAKAPAVKNPKTPKAPPTSGGGDEMFPK